MRALCACLALAAAALLAGCASGPPVPDWSMAAVNHVESFRSAYLKGSERTAEREFQLARSAMARTGRPDLVARIELNRCAVQVASLAFTPCPGFAALAADATSQERAYARYLAGQAVAADKPLLPEQHRAAIAGTSGLAAVKDPLARLTAAGVLLRQERVTPAEVVVAVDTASRQGWRRPLLAWLGVQLRLARDQGDGAGAARIQRRIDLAQAPSN